MSPSPYVIARKHLDAARAEAAAAQIPSDVIARAMLAQVVACFLEGRAPEDVRHELLAAADNVDPDADYAFMRP